MEASLNHHNLVYTCGIKVNGTFYDLVDICKGITFPQPEKYLNVKKQPFDISSKVRESGASDAFR